MWSIFLVPGYRVCEQAGCSSRGLKNSLHELTCSECAHPLGLRMKLDRRVLTLAVGVVTLLGLVIGFGLRAARLRHVAASEAAVLEERRAAVEQSLSRGRALVAERLIEEARAEFEHATEIDPTSSMAWANLGAARMLLGQADAALDAYDRALELDPDNWLAHYNLALASARSGDRRAAFDHISQALTALPPGADRERRALIRDLLEEPAFAELRSDPRFSQILER